MLDERIAKALGLDPERLIPISEYAKLVDRSAVAIRKKAARGGYQTAVKIGNDWYIDRDEPHRNLRWALPVAEEEESRD